MICTHDIIAIAGLAVRVSIAYKDAPDAPDAYRHISEEVAALKLLVDKVAPHFKGTTISQEDYHYGEKTLKDCQSVLEDLDSFIQKYRRLASINKRLVLNRFKLGKEDITALDVQLISKTALLNGFVRSCEYVETQAQLAALLNLHGTNSGISVTSIAAFTANTNTNIETAYKQLCNDLYRVGVTEDIIRRKEDKILEIFRSQGMVASSKSSDSEPKDKDQALEVAYKEYCENLYRMGVTEGMVQQIKGEILEVLRSRGIVGSSNSSGNNIRDKDDDSSTKVLPSFRLSSQINWFESSFEAIDGHNSLVHLAADNSHSGTIELLFDKGASIDKDNNSLLHCAAGGGYTDTVKLLLDRGVPIGSANTDGSTPLHLAAKNGHSSIIKLLLDKGAPNPTKDVLLHRAAENGQYNVVELLLAQGTSIESQDNGKDTALYLAARSHTVTMDLLLSNSNGAAVDRFRNTPLHIAAKNGHSGVVELLLENGASIESIGIYGGTPLHCAALYGRARVVELLLGKGALINAMDGDGDTPLHNAAMGGYTSVVELLLEKGASLDVINKANRTPLDVAARVGHTDMVQLLKERAAELSVRGTHRRPRFLGIFG